jgi:hypothetical protein
MRHFCAAIALTCAVVAVSAARAEGDAPGIAVVGRGTATHPADIATLSFQIHGEGKTAVEALQALSAHRADVEGALAHLAGANVKVTVDNLTVNEARGPSCTSEDRDVASYLSTGACAVVGAIVELKASAEVAPADQAGNAASLAAEKGAVNVELSNAKVIDEKALDDAASKAAIDDAQRQAQAIAAASGIRLGPVVRIEDNEAREQTNVSELVVTANKREALVSPTVQVGYHPPPVTRSATYTVVYSVVK